MSLALILCHLFSPSITCLHLWSPALSPGCAFSVSPLLTFCYLHSSFITCSPFWSASCPSCCMFSLSIARPRLSSPIVTFGHSPSPLLHAVVFSRPSTPLVTH